MKSYKYALKLEHERAKIKYPNLFIKKTVKILPTITENYYSIQYFTNILKNI